jgi:dinuclear metal center YbgI/SA1388 family protein
MRLKTLTDELDKIAPLSYAESWDNVGLITGDPAQNILRIVLTIDYTRAVAAETLPGDCVIAYHPPLFKPTGKLTAEGPHGLVFDAIRRGVAIYSPHTALDVAEGGTNDVLADCLGLVKRKPLKWSEVKQSHFKLVTFVPESAIETVATAITAAGAGRFGAYSQCTFRSPGIGTFRGEIGSNPTIGKPGEFERVNEIRLESFVAIVDAAQVVAALRSAHPYETPAFDLIPLAAEPSLMGIGRIGQLPEPAPVSVVIDRLKKAIGVSTVMVAGNDRTVQRVAVCAGSCGGLLDDAVAAGVDLYVTGEMRHHDAAKAAATGMVVVCTLHSCSERPVLATLKSRLELLPDAVPVVLSQSDGDPFRFA